MLRQLQHQRPWVEECQVQEEGEGHQELVHQVLEGVEELQWVVEEVDLCYQDKQDLVSQLLLQDLKPKRKLKKSSQSKNLK